MKELLEFLLKEAVGLEEFEIEEKSEEGRLSYEVKTASENMGLLIGKSGNTIKSIQNILQVKGRLEDTPVFVNVVETS